MALEAAERDRETNSDEIEIAHPGYLLSQDTFYVGYLKGMGRIYQQAAVDTCRCQCNNVPEMSVKSVPPWG